MTGSYFFSSPGMKRVNISLRMAAYILATATNTNKGHSWHVWNPLLIKCLDIPIIQMDFFFPMDKQYNAHSEWVVLPILLLIPVVPRTYVVHIAENRTEESRSVDWWTTMDISRQRCCGCLKAIEQIPLETYIENKIKKLVYLHMDERQSNWFNFLYFFLRKTEKDIQGIWPWPGRRATSKETNKTHKHDRTDSLLNIYSIYNT